MSSAKRRKTSVYAQARQVVTLPALIVAGYVQIGHELVYEYQGEKYTAHVAPGGYLNASADVNGGSGSRSRTTDDKKLPVYDNPTNWTQDCIAHYNRSSGKTVLTRASPYSRIMVTQADKATLQELRDRYMQEYVNMSPVFSPEAVRTAVRERVARCGGSDDADDVALSSSSSSSSASSSASASPPSTPRAAKKSGDGDRLPRAGEPISVQRVCDGLNTKSYRRVSYVLERRHNKLCERLRQAQATVVTLKAAVDKAAKDGFDVETSLDDDPAWQDGMRRWSAAAAASGSTGVASPTTAPVQPQPKLVRKRSRPRAPVVVVAPPEDAKHLFFSSTLLTKANKN